MSIKPNHFFEFFFMMLLCACLLMLYLRGAENRRADQLYQEAGRLARVLEPVEPPSAPPPLAVPPDEPDEPEIDAEDCAAPCFDLSPLREVNDDVVGWIEIPGVLSYPLLQGGDNAYYLSHAWDGEENSAGAVFLDYRAGADFSDFNTLVYGHRMRNGTMFGSLKFYKDTDFWRENPGVFLSDENGTRRYDIFAAYEVGLTEIVYQRDLSSEADKAEFIQYGLGHSVIDTGITPTTGDTIITLSTCTGSGHSARWVVQAVRGV